MKYIEFHMLDVPEMLTPFLFLELYNDLEPEEEDD